MRRGGPAARSRRGRFGRPAVDLGAKKPRGLFAMLALEVNRPVSVDRLIDGLWGDAPPATAAKLVQVYVSGLRKALDGSGVEIVTRGRGYELRCDAHAVDVTRLERLLDGDGGAGNGARPRSARALAGSAAGRRRRRAVRGSGDRPPGRVAAARAGSGDRGRPRRGRHEQVLPELAGLVAEHPLRERVQGLWMLALLPIRAPGRGARRLPGRAGPAGGADRRRARTRPAAPARGDPAARPGDRRPAVRRSAPAERRAGGDAGRRRPGGPGARRRGHRRPRERRRGAAAHRGLARPDRPRGAVREVYPVGRQPAAVAAGARSLWVANALDGTLTRWTAIATARRRSTSAKSRPRSPSAQAQSGRQRRRPHAEPARAGVEPGGAALPARRRAGGARGRRRRGLGRDAAGGRDRAGQPDRRSPSPSRRARRRAGRGRGRRRIGLVADRESGRVLRIDPRSLAPTASVGVGNGPSALAGRRRRGLGRQPSGRHVSRIDARTASVTATEKIGSEAGALAVGADGLWVADPAGPSLAHLDAAGRLTRRIPDDDQPERAGRRRRRGVGHGARRAVDASRLHVARRGPAVRVHDRRRAPAGDVHGSRVRALLNGRSAP